MSLIYSALNSLDRKPVAGADPVDPRVVEFVPEDKTRTMTWTYVAIVGSLVTVVIGGIALTMLRNQASEANVQLAKSGSAARAAPPAVIAPIAAPVSTPVEAKVAAPITATNVAPIAAATAAQTPANPAPQMQSTINSQAPATVEIAAPRATAFPPTAAGPVMPPPQLVSIEPVSNAAIQKANAQVAAASLAPAPERASPTPDVLAPNAITRHGAAESKSRRAASAGNVARTGANDATDSANNDRAQDEINRLTAAARVAIDAGRKDEADGLLKQLGTKLPAESITLMRLQAWNAMRGGDQAQAQSLYRKIVDRLPEDESASINLAVLHWQAGQRDEAKRIINELADRRPDSENVKRYSVEFGVRK